MTNNAAIDCVLRAAESNANGHEHCREILAAVARVRELFALAERNFPKLEASGSGAASGTETTDNERTTTDAKTKG